MKKFRFLVIAVTLGIAGWVHAATPLPRANASAAATDATATAASFSVNAAQPLAQDFNFTKVNVPYYLESGRASHVPEPEGWAMMLMGAGFVVYQVRRRKRARESWDLR